MAEIINGIETVTGAAIVNPAITGGTIDNTAIGQTTPAAGVFTTFQGRYHAVSSKTDTYTITLADLGKTLRMNSASDKIFNAPSVGASDDGARITIVKIGAGKVTFQCADADTVADSGAGGTIYNSQAAETYATLMLEYVHATTNWVIVSFDGTWTTTD